MARFFIDRPVLAIVVSLFLLLIGTLSLIQLPVGEFPNIALPTVQVNANYLGASSDIVEESVTAPIDQQVNGATDMLYINSVSGDDGSASIAVTFALERDPDLAAVEVQNRVAQANSQLPAEVINAGVTVRKQSPDTLMYLALYSPDETYDPLFISNYGFVYVVDELKRVKGVGDVRVFGSDFGMRVWLKPDRMASLGITAADVAQSIREQNLQVPAGQVGQPPATRGQSFQYSLRVQGRLIEVDEFADVIVGSKPDGSFIRIRDIGRVELGARSYSNVSQLDGKPAVFISATSSPARTRSRSPRVSQDAGRPREELSRRHRLRGFARHDQVRHGLDRGGRAHADRGGRSGGAGRVPVPAEPARDADPDPRSAVSIVGTFVGMTLLGFSVNLLTLFGMVLAIGIVVDDAIVVIEAVEANMKTKGLSARDATFEAMHEVSGPVVAIVLVLAAVFVPTAFIGGTTGVLYKQFAITVVISVILSGFVALTLTPALACCC